jgi:hypothetical protein
MRNEMRNAKLEMRNEECEFRISQFRISHFFFYLDLY